AFVYAHRADPDAKLYLNDYSVEFSGNSKTTAFYNLATRLKNSGIPIDGVGLQCHLTVGSIDSAKFDTNVASYADLGLNCIVTELDIAATTSQFEKQAAAYATIARVALKYDHCPHVVIWGLTDDTSWRTGDNPLLFDATLVAKPAFFSLRDVLAEYATGADGIGSTYLSPEEVSPYVDVYDIMGHLVAKQMLRTRLRELPAGYYIVDRKGMLIY
ncbi:MAG: endo-1,4-beta-xylanase, partial [Porphyromonadaceae bacterium]|nr:endo-1,4-beta-xylanase [Porphyromonadaceae bacterium]